jgi:hypothetical protein
MYVEYIGRCGFRLYGPQPHSVRLYELDAREPRTGPRKEETAYVGGYTLELPTVCEGGW